MFKKIVSFIVCFVLAIILAGCSTKNNSKDNDLVLVEDNYSNKSTKNINSSDNVNVVLGYKYKVLDDNNTLYSYSGDDDVFDFNTFKGFFVCKKIIRNAALSFSYENNVYNLNINVVKPDEYQSISFYVNTLGGYYNDESGSLTKFLNVSILEQVNGFNISIKDLNFGDMLVLDYVGEYISLDSMPSLFNIYNGYVIDYHIDAANIVECQLFNDNIIKINNDIYDIYMPYWDNDYPVIYDRMDHFKMLSNYTVGDTLYATVSNEKIYGLYSFNPQNN